MRGADSQSVLKRDAAHGQVAFLLLLPERSNVVDTLTAAVTAAGVRPPRCPADAQPNSGEISETGLLSRLKAAAADRIYCTLVGQCTLVDQWLFVCSWSEHRLAAASAVDRTCWLPV